jgi:hypothetical protein
MEISTCRGEKKIDLHKTTEKAAKNSSLSLTYETSFGVNGNEMKQFLLLLSVMIKVVHSLMYIFFFCGAVIFMLSRQLRRYKESNLLQTRHH